MTVVVAVTPVIAPAIIVPVITLPLPFMPLIPAISVIAVVIDVVNLVSGRKHDGMAGTIRRVGPVMVTTTFVQHTETVMVATAERDAEVGLDRDHAAGVMAVIVTAASHGGA